MDATDYWPMVREYSIWNATIASLQFWTAHLDPVALDRATEQVYTTFSTQLSLADDRYESGSDTVNLPTPLRKTPRIHLVSSMEHASFNPAPVTP